MLPFFLLWITVSLLYIGLAGLSGNDRVVRLGRLGWLGWLLPLGLHGAGWLDNSQNGIGMGQALSGMAWLSVLMWWLNAWRYPVRALALPLGVGAALLAPLAAWQTHGAPTLPTAWPTLLHVALSLLSVAFLTLATLQALALLWLEKQLKKPRQQTDHWPLNASSLPPLQVMEHLMFQWLTVGFVALSLALLMGLLFVHNFLAQHLLHKALLSLLTWLIYAYLLWQRFRQGLRGRAAIHRTVWAYGLLMLAYVGSKWVLETLLGRHWG
jgi:ABC-type uncharacterized transport system permease subunit